MLGLAKLPNSHSLFPEWRDPAATLLTHSGFFSSLVGHTFPRHILPLSKCFVQAPGCDHKKCPFLWRAHLRREVSESQTARSKDIPGTCLSSQRVHGWRPQTAHPSPTPGPYRIAPWFLLYVWQKSNHLKDLLVCLEGFCSTQSNLGKTL
jgi:hypothetical protein